ncbi:Bax inhibitor-1/YccA family protein [Halobacillus karajensis]|uniref:Membrane protein n=1 Tax=Halobacillus karajensis TaxID=195088 RepID=A0A059NYJ5_9BACI|nr:Bax inhibitor-1/YccA family protein [Halobacillus karajensis]CDQ18652.1 putative membrane protein [Halobacillus karajensis]CDQ23276.1 putative membrane protein [Halobacillus karajensis]CDQ26758.1 putative membrane protein [Halobacillus karajensis]
MRSGNPVLKNGTFQRSGLQGESMTLGGTVAKISLLFLFLLGTATYTWYQYSLGADVTIMMVIGAIGGLIFALITAFFPKAAPVTAPIYAALEGFFIGGISAFVEGAYSGIVIQAVSLTMAVMGALLFLYATRIIKVTKNFRLMVVSATLGIFLVYLVNFILNFFGLTVPYLHSSGPIGIGISLVIVAVAALNLVLDFDFIEQGVNRGAPKHMEWYGAFGLIVTLVWLYIEILRLLQKIRR